MTDILARLSAAIHLESAAIAPQTSPLIEAAKEARGELQDLRTTVRKFAEENDTLQALLTQFVFQATKVLRGR